MLARHEVLRLQLLARAGCKAHAEMRQPFIPSAGHAQLLSAIFGGKVSYGVKIPGCQLGPKKFRSRVKRLACFHAALDPDLVDPLFLPVGKKANAVSACFDLLEVIFQLAQRKITSRRSKQALTAL